MLFFNGWTINTVLIALIQAVRYALVLTFFRVIVEKRKIAFIVQDKILEQQMLY